MLFLFLQPKINCIRSVATIQLNRRHVCLLCRAVFQSNPYALKEGGGEMSAWTSAGLQPSGGYYPYDPTLAAYG